MTKTQVKRASKAIQRPGENGFNHRQRYGLVIECRDEAHQQTLYADLVKRGLSPKVVCV